MAHERALRICTVVNTAIALPLLIAMTIISLEPMYHGARDVTAFCFAYIPLALTALTSGASLRHYRKHGRMPGPPFALLDCVAGILYLSVLLPIWIVEIGALADAGAGLVAGYLTAPMIVNMLVHFFNFTYNIRSVWASLSNIGLNECPHCRSNYKFPTLQARTTAQNGTGYSLTRGELYLDADADAVPYADARPSEDMIRPEAEDKTEVKGKAIAEV